MDVKYKDTKDLFNPDLSKQERIKVYERLEEKEYEDYVGLSVFCKEHNVSRKQAVNAFVELVKSGKAIVDDWWGRLGQEEARIYIPKGLEQELVSLIRFEEVHSA